MTRLHKQTRKIDIRKAAVFAITVNAMQILVLVVFMAYVLFVDWNGGKYMVQALAVISAGVASWGAMLDIRQAFHTHRGTRTIAELEQTNTLMDGLNHKLRAQRHDFLNHLQVVYSLMEMREYEDATDYLEKVYGEIRAVSSVLRTKSTAVNALLQVKTAACEDQGIAFTGNIKSTLEGVTLPSWELCGVLSNLLDNAMDAAAHAPEPSIELDILENLRGFIFTVRNNGGEIPEGIGERLFDAGVSTKGEGRGMGLHIVRQTLEDVGGTIDYQCENGETVFTAFLPKLGTGLD